MPKNRKWPAEVPGGPVCGQILFFFGRGGKIRGGQKSAKGTPGGGQPKPFVSPLIDWLAWFGLARLASAWLSRPQTTATTPEEADKTTGAALRAAPVVVAASSGVVAVVVAAADETSHAEARLAKPSQSSQSREGLTNEIGYFCDGKWQARGLTTGCGTGYIQFVT